MNLFFSFWTIFPFLDLVITPRSTPTPLPLLDQVVTPQTTVTPDSSLTKLLLLLLILFLTFIGCLIWSALKKKK